VHEWNIARTAAGHADGGLALRHRRPVRPAVALTAARRTAVEVSRCQVHRRQQRHGHGAPGRRAASEVAAERRAASLGSCDTRRRQPVARDRPAPGARARSAVQYRHPVSSRTNVAPHLPATAEHCKQMPRL